MPDDEVRHLFEREVPPRDCTRAATTPAPAARRRSGLPLASAVRATPPHRLLGSEPDRVWVEAIVAPVTPLGKELRTQDCQRALAGEYRAAASSARRTPHTTTSPGFPFVGALFATPPHPHARARSNRIRIKALVARRVPLAQQVWPDHCERALTGNPPIPHRRRRADPPLRALCDSRDQRGDCSASTPVVPAFPAVPPHLLVRAHADRVRVEGRVEGRVPLAN
jgi:hypothetical protein